MTIKGSHVYLQIDVFMMYQHRFFCVLLLRKDVNTRGDSLAVLRASVLCGGSGSRQTEDGLNLWNVSQLHLKQVGAEMRRRGERG